MRSYGEGDKDTSYAVVNSTRSINLCLSLKLVRECDEFMVRDCAENLVFKIMKTLIIFPNCYRL